MDSTPPKDSRSISVAIVPGFAEGKWHVSRLETALEDCGYIISSDIHTADVVVTHSAGCFYIPDPVPGQRLILINPPYWPSKSTSLSTLQKIWWEITATIREHRIRYELRKTYWNWFYIITDFGRMLEIARLASTHNFHDALASHHVSVIRNDHDAYFMPNAETTLPPRETFAYYHLPGEHDDCWFTTAEHAELIDQIIRTSGSIET